MESQRATKAANGIDVAIPKTISRTALAAVNAVKTAAIAHRLMGDAGFRIGS
jgi:hypothetical protein